jgi:methionyl-tRNA formyltransferase
VPSFDALRRRSDIELVAAYTQPDRPAGRGRRVVENPVKRAARAAGIAIEQPEHLHGAATHTRFCAYRADLLVVAAYGLLLPDAFIAKPLVALNVHASLLPRWRGAAPIQRALLAGDRTTGISIMRVVRKLDAGPVWLMRACAIEPDDTGGTLHDKLAALGAQALDAALDDLVTNRAVETEQNEELATYAAKLTAADRDLDWRRPAAELARQVRALNPAPGALATLGGHVIKVVRGHVLAERAANAAGSILRATREGIAIATGDDVYVIDELQPAGRQRMSAAEFVNGYRAWL